MSEKLDIFADTARCPSLELLTSYLDGGLSSRQRQELEHHMIDCSLCTDALEGLESVADRQRVSSTVQRIRTESKRRLFEQNPYREKSSKRRYRAIPRHFIPYAASAAAAVFLLWIGVFIYRDLNQAQLVYEKHFQAEDTAPATPLAADVAPLPDTTAAALPSSAVTPNAPLASNQQRELQSLTQQPAASPQPVTAQAKPPVRVAEATSTPAAGDLADQQIASGASSKPGGSDPASIDNRSHATHEREIPDAEDFLSESSMDAPQRDEMISSSERTRDERHAKPAPSDSVRNHAPSVSADVLAGRQQLESKKESAASIANYSPVQGYDPPAPYQTPDMKLGLQHFETGEYAQALTDFERVLTTYPDFTQAQYLAARSHLELGAPDKAIDLLKSVTKSGDPAYFQDAQWQLAGAYLLHNRKQPAIKLLKQIAAEAGPFQEKARAALKDL